MDILKAKIKNQEMEKTIADKNKIIKDLKDTVLEHEKKNI